MTEAVGADRAYPPGHSLAYDYLVGRITEAEYDAAVAAQSDEFVRRHERAANAIAVNWFIAGLLFGLTSATIGISVLSR